MYVRQRVEMFARIREKCKFDYVEQMEEEWQLNVLIGIGWKKKGKEIREIVVKYIREANNIRNKYI